jgi:glycosyltransferase involved in cell wall biosynthesis
LISPLTDQEAQDSVFSGGQRIRLVFVGKLYKRVRSPDFLLRLFVELLQTHLGDKLELHFFGDTSDCQDAFKSYQSLFGKKVFFYGQVSHQKALQAMKKADVLVNIGNSTPYQLPSKVVEYVSTGRPILHIAKTDVDGSGEFFKAYPASLCLLDTTGPPDSGQIAAVVQFVERTSPVDLPTLGHWLSQFQTGAIASSYEKIFKP